MLVYWDSSALLNALCSQPVQVRLARGEHLTSSHAYVEAFHHLSGKGLPLKDVTRLAVSPSDAAAMLRKLAVKVPSRDLSQEQTLTALDDAQGRGVSGRMVHDWIHVRTAKTAGAHIVLTRDQAMSGLCAAEGLNAECHKSLPLPKDAHMVLPLPSDGRGLG